MRIHALQIAQEINLKEYKKKFDKNLIHQNKFELFYQFSDNKYLLILDYGVIVFWNYEQSMIDYCLQASEEFLKNPIEKDLYLESLEVKRQSDKIHVESDVLYLPTIDSNKVKIAMLQLAQSIAISYYSDLSESLMQSVNDYTIGLEKTGKIKTSKKDLLKFIGSCMNLRTNIIDNLYIIDIPELAWENEDLSSLHNKMRDYFEIRRRFHHIEKILEIVNDNLHFLTEMLHQKESVILEVIIVLLILFEIVQIFIFG